METAGSTKDDFMSTVSFGTDGRRKFFRTASFLPYSAGREVDAKSQQLTRTFN